MQAACLNFGARTSTRHEGRSKPHVTLYGVRVVGSGSWRISRFEFSDITRCRLKAHPKDCQESRESGATFSAAADEANSARIWGGIHFRTAVHYARAVGDAIGAYVVANDAQLLHGAHTG